MTLPSGLSSGSARALQKTLATDGIRLATSGLATYFANGTGYQAYATPTDMLTISGAADKIIRIYQMQMRVQVTSGALATINWIKRSTANTAGTSTSPTGAPYDSGDAAHSATIRLYSVIPSALGTAVFTAPNHVVTTATTAVPAVFTTVTPFASSAHGPISFTKPLTLRGAAESLCANFGGAALPSGFTAWWEIIWSEQAV